MNGHSLSAPVAPSWRAELRLTLAVMCLAIALTPGMETLDVYLARFFFDAGTGEWLVPDGRPLIWHLLYRAPKVLLVVIAVGHLIAFVGGFFSPRLRRYRTALLLSLLALGLIPGLVSWLKHVTDIYCPYQTEIFGGGFLHVGIFDAYPPGLQRAKPGECWPAGHASGGFALMGLMLFAERANRRRRVLLTLPGFTLGWVMGIFQMARGQHYLSHNLASLGIALVTIWALERAASVCCAVGSAHKAKVGRR